MIWQLGNNRTRFIQTDKVILQWLKERQDLLITYNELCHIQPFEGSSTLPTLLQTFCQSLIDYVSVGHFKIFELMAKTQANCTSKAHGLDNNLLTQILRTTLNALDFNDTYEHIKDYGSISEDLSSLGQELAHRMDWEDKLIQNYLFLTSESPQATAASF